ncbi:hypothetical protein GGF44_003654, partial [Coemansia sp. RSA 1694]
IKSTSDLVANAKPLGVSTANISAGQKLITAGWGQTSNDSPGQSNALKYAQLVTANDATCKVGAADWNGQNGRYVCTSYSATPRIGTCFGDSGGPLLMSSGSGYSLLGLVSFDVNTEDSSNTKCAQVGNVSYFTRVSSYLSYISSVTGIPDSVLVGGNAPWSHTAAVTSESETKEEPATTSRTTTTKEEEEEKKETNTSTSTSAKISATSSTTTNAKPSSSSSKNTASGSKPSSSASSNSSSGGKPVAKPSGSSAASDSDNEKPSDASDNSGSDSSSDSSTTKNSGAAGVLRLVPASAAGLLVGAIAALF